MGTPAIDEGTVGALKRAAIDAWMKGEAARRIGFLAVTDDSYTIAMVDGAITIHRPDAGGSGGGLGHSSYSVDGGMSAVLTTGGEREDYTGHFETICATIDRLLEPWRELPDPAAVAKYVENCRAVTTRLSRTAWNDGEGVHRGAGVVLDSCMRDLETFSEGIGGATGNSFRQKFLYAVPAVIESHMSLTLSRGGVMLGQQRLWESARADISAIVHRADYMFKVIAGGGTSKEVFAFQVVDAALEGIRLFAPGLIGKTIDIARYGVKVGANSLPTGTNFEADDYEQAIALLSDALHTLSGHIREQERFIEQALAAHAEASRSSAQRASYELQVPSLSEDGWISFDPEKADTLASSTLPTLAAELDEVADLNHQCSKPSVVARAAVVGLGEFGPSQAIKNFDLYIHDLLEELAADVLDGAVRLRRVISDFTETEETIVRRLNALIAGVDGITADRPAVGPLDGELPVWTAPPLSPDAIPERSSAHYLDLDRLMRADGGNAP